MGFIWWNVLKSECKKLCFYNICIFQIYLGLSEHALIYCYKFAKPHNFIQNIDYAFINIGTIFMVVSNLSSVFFAAIHAPHNDFAFLKDQIYWHSHVEVNIAQHIAVVVKNARLKYATDRWTTLLTLCSTR